MRTTHEKESGKVIKKDMKINEVVKEYPETLPVFIQHGFGCIGCQAALFEEIGQGAAIHGVDADTLVERLNKVLTEG